MLIGAWHAVTCKTQNGHFWREIPRKSLISVQVVHSAKKAIGLPAVGSNAGLKTFLCEIKTFTLELLDQKILKDSCRLIDCQCLSMLHFTQYKPQATLNKSRLVLSIGLVMRRGWDTSMVATMKLRMNFWHICPLSDPNSYGWLWNSLTSSRRLVGI